jgi:hypothetical protein
LHLWHIQKPGLRLVKILSLMRENVSLAAFGVGRRFAVAGSRCDVAVIGGKHLRLRKAPSVLHSLSSKATQSGQKQALRNVMDVMSLSVD